MKYIDFDDVIMNTSEVIIKKYNNDESAPIVYFDDDEYIKNYNWDSLLHESKPINNAIEIIKSFDPNEVTILTKIISLENEGIAKVKFIREMGIKCNIILVPEHIKKTDVVMAKNNVLIDDGLKNLDDWEKAGGKAIFFDRFNTGIDGWGVKNTKYESSNTLEILKKY